MSRASNSTIARATLRSLQSSKKIDSVATSLAAYLVAEKQTSKLHAIIREIERLLLKEHQTLYIHVTSAHDLSNDVLLAIKKAFQQEKHTQNIQIEHTINRAVVGGVRCETAEQRLDLTVRRQLQRLKRVRHTGD